MYNKRQELIIDFIKDNPKAKREDIEFFLNQIEYANTIIDNLLNNFMRYAKKEIKITTIRYYKQN